MEKIGGNLQFQVLLLIQIECFLPPYFERFNFNFILLLFLYCDFLLFHVFLFNHLFLFDVSRRNYPLFLSPVYDRLLWSFYQHLLFICLYILELLLYFRHFPVFLFFLDPAHAEYFKLFSCYFCYTHNAKYFLNVISLLSL